MHAVGSGAENVEHDVVAVHAADFVSVALHPVAKIAGAECALDVFHRGVQAIRIAHVPRADGGGEFLNIILEIAPRNVPARVAPALSGSLDLLTKVDDHRDDTR